MSQKLYVGSLSYNLDSKNLEEIFSSVGKVTSAQVIMDRDSGRSKGFGFIEMSTEEEAKKAIRELNGTTHDGRAIAVSEAKPQTSRGGGRSGDRGRDGRSGGGNWR